MATIKIEIIHQPSRSKGWGAYKCELLGDRLNYSTKEVEAEFGAKVEVAVWAMNRTGSGKETKKCEKATFEVSGSVDDVVTLMVKPGSQDCEIKVTGVQQIVS
jgi:hypothetical protein